MTVALICLSAWATAAILWGALRHIRGLAPLLFATALAIPGILAARSLNAPFLQGACLAPLALLAPLDVARRLSPDLVRAAEGLGADARLRLRLIWWPAYAKALGCSAILPPAASLLLEAMHGP